MVRAWRAGSRPGEERTGAKQSCHSRSWARANGSTAEPWEMHRKWQHFSLDSLGLVWGRGEGSRGCHTNVSPGTGRCTSTGRRMRTSWSCGRGIGWMSCNSVMMDGLWVCGLAGGLGGRLEGGISGSQWGFGWAVAAAWRYWFSTDSWPDHPTAPTCPLPARLLGRPDLDASPVPALLLLPSCLNEG